MLPVNSPSPLNRCVDVCRPETAQVLWGMNLPSLIYPHCLAKVSGHKGSSTLSWQGYMTSRGGLLWTPWQREVRGDYFHDLSREAQDFCPRSKLFTIGSYLCYLPISDFITVLGSIAIIQSKRVLRNPRSFKFIWRSCFKMPGHPLPVPVQSMLSLCAGLSRSMVLK